MSETSPSNVPPANTLCVDLDGTLVRTDTLYECFILLLKSAPWKLLLLPWWLLKGRAAFKRLLASAVNLNVDSLPYREDLLSFLSTEKNNGRKIVLATASDIAIASKVAEKVGIFSEVFGSDGETNLKGSAKRDLLVSKFGAKGYSYIGDSRADLPIWSSASHAIVISDGESLSNAAAKVCEVTKVFQAKRAHKFYSLFQALRVHQWVKNILIFVPLIAAHRVFAPGVATPYLLTDALFAIAAFSLTASSVYILNDLLDLESDRNHRTKRFRPFASGEMSILSGLLMIPALLIGSYTIAELLPFEFLVSLGLYLTITLVYSFWLKQLPLLDTITLASLYTLRILAGGLALAIPVSPWLLAFSMFFFFSLAIVKRLSELKELRRSEKKVAKGRGYFESDLEALAQFGSSSAYISILVLVLYANDPLVANMYRHPKVLWFICPILLYWLSRLLLFAQRGSLHEDPVVYALKDKASYIAGLLAAAVVLLAM